MLLSTLPVIYMIYMKSNSLIKIFLIFSKFNIVFKGNIDDPIVNAAIEAITKTFRTSVINMVNIEFSKVLQEFIGEINKKIPQPNQILNNDNIWRYLKSNLS